MNKSFLSNRNKSCARRQAHWKYRDGVEAELCKLDVPTMVATLAVLDYGHVVLEGMQKHLSFEETACTMIDTVKHIYQRKDGSWLCAGG